MNAIDFIKERKEKFIISIDIPQICIDVELICLFVQSYLSNDELILELLPYKENRDPIPKLKIASLNPVF